MGGALEVASEGDAANPAQRSAAFLGADAGCLAPPAHEDGRCFLAAHAETLCTFRCHGEMDCCQAVYGYQADTYMFSTILPSATSSNALFLDSGCIWSTSAYAGTEKTVAHSAQPITERRLFPT